jgi:hypothetical protein
VINRREQEQLYERELGAAALERQKREAAKRCRSCFAPIVWTRRRGGSRWGGPKPMPVDYDQHEGGNIALYQDGTYEVVPQDAPLPPGTTRHYSHFATCRDARSWRK